MSAPSSSLFCHELAPGWLQHQYYSSALRSTGLLAALGVVSYDANIRTVMRNATRHSWLSSAPTFGLAAHFVLRGLHIPESSLVWGESKAHGDLLLLNASTHMNRQVGPLVSLFLWYECATEQYPEVPFVGKLDDDAWLQVPGMAAILSAATHWADRKWAAYIGRLECYSWHVVDEGPMMWRSGGSWNKCYRPRGQHGELLVGPNKWNYTGPFAFAKGGANFLSMRPVRHLVATRREHVALIAGMGWRCTPGSSAWNAVVNGTKVCQHAAHTAWEDVWTGYALAHGEFGPLLLVDLAAGFIDTYGVTTRPSILAWHGRIDTDYPRRAALLKRGLQCQTRCATGRRSPAWPRARRRPHASSVTNQAPTTAASARNWITVASIHQKSVSTESSTCSRTRPCSRRSPRECEAGRVSAASSTTSSGGAIAHGDVRRHPFEHMR